MAPNLTSRALNSLKWSYLGIASNAIFQLIFTAIMARLLDPKAFGIVAIVTVVIRFASFFSQFGITSAVVQKDNLTEEDIKGAFSLSILMSIVFILLIQVLAPITFHIFRSEEVVVILRFMGLSFFASGLSSIPIGQLKRDLKFKQLTICEVTSAVIGFGSGIMSAYIGFGVWSLVVSNLSQQFSLSVLSLILKPQKFTFYLNIKEFKWAYSFGGKVSLIGLFEFLTANLDTMIIGKFLGTGLLGIYNRSYMIVNLPLYHVANGFNKMLFPFFSKIKNDFERLRSAYMSAITISSVLFMSICAGIIPAASEIVKVILSDKWADSIPILRILTVAVVFNLLSIISGIVCEAKAFLMPKFYLMIASVLVEVTFFYFLYSYKLQGFAYAVLITEFFRFLGYQFLIKKILHVSIKKLIQCYQPAIICSFAVITSIFFVTELSKKIEIAVFFVFSAQFITGLVVLISILLFFPPELFRQEFKFRFSHYIVNKPLRKNNLLVVWLYKSALLK